RKTPNNPPKRFKKFYPPPPPPPSLNIICVILTEITISDPAFGQSGLFATQHLSPGSLILPYLGEYHPGSGPGLQNSDGYDYSKSDYDLWLDREGDVAVDAARCGNEARFVNDYRGVPYHPPPPGPGAKQPKQQKGRPNAEFRVAWDERRQERVMSVWVLPEGKKGLNKGVERGGEVLVSYGRGFWEERRRGEQEGGDQEEE
ncbi:hypothetical protein QBC36DRAFT_201075, partial [Triangularia setosa]